MSGPQRFEEIIGQTRVLRFPRHRIATFGDSEIQYNLVSAVSAAPPRATLRIGRVTAERPKILTPEALAQRFRGFGSRQEAFERWLRETFQDAFRGLEYSFRNRLDAAVPHSLDARELAQNIRRDLDERDVARAAVIYGPEEGWQLSLMKFIFEETTQSFPANLRELEERNLFDPAQAELSRRRREIEALFRRAAQDPSARRALGDKLKEYRLFDEYQDRFFALVRA